jgi:competence ComEA-like helix-hairpin-helix protein
MNRENDSLRKWLVFSRSEKRGISILLIIIFLLITIRIVQKNYNKKEYEIIRNQSELTDITKNISNKDHSQLSDISTNRFVPIGIQFNPNKANLKELIKQGIPVDIAKRIIKYRSKGGVFYKPSDLFKIYGIDSILVVELIPWMVISETRQSGERNTPSYEISASRPIIQIEINSADSSAFCKLTGIGPVLSRRIIKYRELLGGFYSYEQLSEVYGISDSLLSNFSQNLLIDTSLIKRIAINSATYSELKRHPYLTSYEVKAILSYRRLIGPFTDREELIENYIISENTYRKIRSYLSLN